MMLSWRLLSQVRSVMSTEHLASTMHSACGGMPHNSQPGGPPALAGRTPLRTALPTSSGTV